MKLTAFQKITLFSIFVLSAFLYSCISRTPVSAYTLTHAINTTVSVTSPSEAMVTQEHNLSIDSATYFFPATKNFLYVYIFPAFKSQEESLLNEISDLTVKSKGTGDVLSFEKSLSDGAIQVKIPYFDNLERNNDLGFVVTYKTGIYTQKTGGLLEVSFPGLSKEYKSKIANKSGGYDEIDTYSIHFAMPDTLGAISSIYPNVTTQSSSKGKTTLTFASSALVGNSVRITVGDQRLVKFVLTGKTYATNDSSPDFVKDLLVNYIEVVLPSGNGEGTESAGQTVYYSKIEPFPTEIRIDTDGNILAKIPVSAVKSGEIIIEGYAAIKGIELPDSIKNTLISTIPSTMEVYFSEESKYWQVNAPEIAEIVHNKVPTDTNMLAQIRKTLAFVSQNLTYSTDVSSASLSRLGAVSALAKKRGVCMEYSDLTLTLLRAQKIPTRTVFGDGVGAHIDKTLKGIGHQWVSVWFPGSGWIPVDPTWSDNNREYIGHDFDHFTWYVASKSDNEPSGFNCLSWDTQSPCKDALQISTLPVNVLPNKNELMTLQDLKQKVNSENLTAGPVKVALQKGITYLGSSQLGRVLLSKTGLLVIFAITLYTVLVSIVSAVSRKVKEKRAGAPTTTR